MTPSQNAAYLKKLNILAKVQAKAKLQNDTLKAKYNTKLAADKAKLAAKKK